jgi:hypothetical protein
MQTRPDELLLLECLETTEALAPEEQALRRRDQEEAAHAAARITGVVIGKVVGWDSEGRAVVDYPGNNTEKPLPATSAAVLDVNAVGRDAALMFLGGDPARPIIIGLIERFDTPPPPTKTAEMDGKQLVFTADEEIVFRCGKASITLTKAGKILIRGAYLLSRSSGVNRIKGGSVQIN